MKKFFWEKIKILPFLLVFCLLLPSCSHGGGDLDLLFSAFDAKISFRRDQELFVADVSVGALTDSSRSAHLLFSSPECMSGVSITLDGDRKNFALGSVSLGAPPDEYIEILSLLTPTGAFKLISKNEREICYSCGDVKWYFDVESKRPTAIEGSEGIKIEILEIGKAKK